VLDPACATVVEADVQRLAESCVDVLPVGRVRDGRRGYLRTDECGADCRPVIASILCLPDMRQPKQLALRIDRIDREERIKRNVVVRSREKALAVPGRPVVVGAIEEVRIRIRRTRDVRILSSKRRIGIEADQASVALRRVLPNAGDAKSGRVVLASAEEDGWVRGVLTEPVEQMRLKTRAVQAFPRTLPRR